MEHIDLFRKEHCITCHIRERERCHIPKLCYIAWSDKTITDLLKENNTCKEASEQFQKFEDDMMKILTGK